MVDELSPSTSTDNFDFSKIGTILESQEVSLVIKRVFDVVVSVCGLLLLALFFLIIAVIIKLDSKGSVFYRQIRVGRYGNDFRIFKFRTMIPDADKSGQLITVGDDARITKIGRFLRKTKIDELPQIMNILIGDMSFVGPRPEVRKYVDMYSEAQQQILLIRPGITDIASIKYRNESELLALSSNPEKTYCEEIMPSKLNLNMNYLSDISLINDIKIILTTIISIIK